LTGRESGLRLLRRRTNLNTVLLDPYNLGQISKIDDGSI
jgi:hypothetical protein